MVTFHLLNREVKKDLCTSFKTTTIDKLILKLIWKCIRPKISKTIFKKSQVGRLIVVVDLKSYYKAVFIKTLW